MRLAAEYLDGIELADGEVVVFENVRFNKGEGKNDETLSRKLAALCDVFVMDAFGTAHRAHRRLPMVLRVLRQSLALARYWQLNLTHLAAALKNPKRPLVAIVGGSKVSTKLTVLESLSGIVDQLVVGGGIANTFIAATGSQCW